MAPRSKSNKKLKQNTFLEATSRCDHEPLEEVNSLKHVTPNLEEQTSASLNRNNDCDIEISGFSGDSGVFTTPKSERKNPSGVKRWASVVKAQKKIMFPSESSDCIKLPISCGDDTNLNSSDPLPESFPAVYYTHRGFFVLNNSEYSCTICSEELGSLLALNTHLRTRKHEDNIITSLKSKLPMRLQYTMDFVSFCESNLYCNLCQNTIDLSSFNLHETIINIISHNSDVGHVNLKGHQESNSIASNILESVSKTHPKIKENIHLVDTKMKPQFRCTLCDKILLYNDNTDALSRNFTTHFNGGLHFKKLKAVEALTLFGEKISKGKDSFVITNSNLFCKYCNIQVEADVGELIVHEESTEHAKNAYARMKLHADTKETVNTLLKECPKTPVAKSVSCEVPIVSCRSPAAVEKENKSFNKLKAQCDSKLNGLLHSELKGMEFVVKNNQGSITCLICDHVVAPNQRNLKTHLMGSNHKQNLSFVQESKKRVEEDKKEIKTVNRNAEGTIINKECNSAVCSSQRLDGVQDNKIPSSKIKAIPSDLMVHVSTKHHNIRKEKQQSTVSSSSFSKSATNETFNLNTVPVFLKGNKHHKIEKITKDAVNKIYKLICKHNSIIPENKNVLIKNLDGMNSYCKSCKSLIPLSLDADKFENQMVSHLMSKKHKSNFVESNMKSVQTTRLNSLCETTDLTPLKSPKVPAKDGKTPKSKTLKNSDQLVENLSSEVIKNESLLYSDVTQKSSENKETDLSAIKTEIEPHHLTDIFIFEGNKTIIDDCDKPRRPPAPSGQSLPVKKIQRFINVEMEMDEAVLCRRQKQIDYGKNTEGYSRYCQEVAFTKRRLSHPSTPPKYVKCSRRTWDGLIRVWRRKLHDWDTAEATQLYNDIKSID